MRVETILRGARSVDFPAKPAVSAEVRDSPRAAAGVLRLTHAHMQAKAFIRKCLTYNQAERPDVQAAAADPYLSYAKKPAAEADI